MDITPEEIRFINTAWIIKVTFKDKSTRLVGAGKYYTVVGQKFAREHFDRVLASSTNRTTIKMRRGLTIDFYVR